MSDKPDRENKEVWTCGACKGINTDRRERCSVCDAEKSKVAGDKGPTSKTSRPPPLEPLSPASPGPTIHATPVTSPASTISRSPVQTPKTPHTLRSLTPASAKSSSPNSLETPNEKRSNPPLMEPSKQKRGSHTPSRPLITPSMEECKKTSPSGASPPVNRAKSTPARPKSASVGLPTPPRSVATPPRSVTPSGGDSVRGWLWKTGKKGLQQAFKRRWFVLLQSYLAYYKRESDKKPRGQIPVSGTIIQEIISGTEPQLQLLQTNGFSLVHQQRTYYIRAETVEERKLWYNAIAEKIRTTRDSLASPHTPSYMCMMNAFKPRVVGPKGKETVAKMEALSPSEKEELGKQHDQFEELKKRRKGRLTIPDWAEILEKTEQGTEEAKALEGPLSIGSSPTDLTPAGVLESLNVVLAASDAQFIEEFRDRVGIRYFVLLMMADVGADVRVYALRCLRNLLPHCLEMLLSHERSVVEWLVKRIGLFIGVNAIHIPDVQKEYKEHFLLLEKICGSDEAGVKAVWAALNKQENLTLLMNCLEAEVIGVVDAAFEFVEATICNLQDLQERVDARVRYFTCGKGLEQLIAKIESKRQEEKANSADDPTFCMLQRRIVAFRTLEREEDRPSIVKGWKDKEKDSRLSYLSSCSSCSSSSCSSSSTTTTTSKSPPPPPPTPSSSSSSSSASSSSSSSSSVFSFSSPFASSSLSLSPRALSRAPSSLPPFCPAMVIVAPWFGNTKYPTVYLGDLFPVVHMPAFSEMSKAESMCPIWATLQRDTVSGFVLSLRDTHTSRVLRFFVTFASTEDKIVMVVSDLPLWDVLRESVVRARSAIQKFQASSFSASASLAEIGFHELDASLKSYTPRTLFLQCPVPEPRPEPNFALVCSKCDPRLLIRVWIAMMLEVKVLVLSEDDWLLLQFFECVRALLLPCVVIRHPYHPRGVMSEQTLSWVKDGPAGFFGIQTRGASLEKSEMNELLREHGVLVVDLKFTQDQQPQDINGEISTEMKSQFTILKAPMATFGWGPYNVLESAFTTFKEDHDAIALQSVFHTLILEILWNSPCWSAKEEWKIPREMESDFLRPEGRAFMMEFAKEGMMGDWRHFVQGPSSLRSSLASSATSTTSTNAVQPPPLAFAQHLGKAQHPCIQVFSAPNNYVHKATYIGADENGLYMILPAPAPPISPVVALASEIAVALGSPAAAPPPPAPPIRKHFTLGPTVRAKALTLFAGRQNFIELSFEATTAAEGGNRVCNVEVDVTPGCIGDLLRLFEAHATPTGEGHVRHSGPSGKPGGHQGEEKSFARQSVCLQPQDEWKRSLAKIEKEVSDRFDAEEKQLERKEVVRQTVVEWCQEELRINTRAPQGREYSKEAVLAWVRDNFKVPESLEPLTVQSTRIRQWVELLDSEMTPIITELRSKYKYDRKNAALKTCKQIQTQIAQLRKLVDKQLLVVFGATSSGKSTLVNTLLGMQYLPVVNCQGTSKVMEVTYAEQIALREMRKLLGVPSPAVVPTAATAARGVAPPLTVSPESSPPVPEESKYSETVKNFDQTPEGHAKLYQYLEEIAMYEGKQAEASKDIDLLRLTLPVRLLEHGVALADFPGLLQEVEAPLKGYMRDQFCIGFLCAVNVTTWPDDNTKLMLDFVEGLPLFANESLLFVVTHLDQYDKDPVKQRQKFDSLSASLTAKYPGCTVISANMQQLLAGVKHGLCPPGYPEFVESVGKFFRDSLDRVLAAASRAPIETVEKLLRELNGHHRMLAARGTASIPQVAKEYREKYRKAVRDLEKIGEENQEAFVRRLRQYFAKHKADIAKAWNEELLRTLTSLATIISAPQAGKHGKRASEDLGRKVAETYAGVFQRIVTLMRLEMTKFLGGEDAEKKMISKFEHDLERAYRNHLNDTREVRRASSSTDDAFAPTPRVFVRHEAEKMPLYHRVKAWLWRDDYIWTFDQKDYFRFVREAEVAQYWDILKNNPALFVGHVVDAVISSVLEDPKQRQKSLSRTLTPGDNPFLWRAIQDDFGPPLKFVTEVAANCFSFDKRVQAFITEVCQPTIAGIDTLMQNPWGDCNESGSFLYRLSETLDILLAFELAYAQKIPFVYEVVEPGLQSVTVTPSAEVFSAVLKATGEQICVKKLRRQPQFWLRFHREYQLMQDFDHPNILKSKGRCAFGVLFSPDGDDDFTCLGIMSEMANGDLRDLIKKGRIPSEEIRRIAKQVASAMQCLDEHFIVYRDLKPENVLVFESREGNKYKLCDFGESRVESEARTEAGTPGYIAPEVGKDVYSVHADKWSFGILLFELYHHRTPSCKVVGRQLFPAQVRYDKPCPTWLTDIIDACLKVDPIARADWPQICRLLEAP